MAGAIFPLPNQFVSRSQPPSYGRGDSHPGSPRGWLWQGRLRSVARLRHVTCAKGEGFSGSITFVPDKGRPGPAATTGVRGGYYRFDGTNGPTAGPHKVMIRKIVPPGRR